MTIRRFAYVWQYDIEPARRPEFLAAYGPGGEWVRLFSRDPAYIETRLLQAAGCENRYLTIDFWTSRTDRDLFRRRFRADFEALDRKCESFTRSEQHLGDYLDLAGRED